MPALVRADQLLSLENLLAHFEWGNWCASGTNFAAFLAGSLPTFAGTVSSAGGDRRTLTRRTGYFARHILRGRPSTPANFFTFRAGNFDLLRSRIHLERKGFGPRWPHLVGLTLREKSQTDRVLGVVDQLKLHVSGDGGISIYA